MGKWLFNSLFPGESITYKEKLIECVSKKMSGNQIAKELCIDYSCVHRWLRKLGLNLPNYHNELKFDNTVFDTIDTEEKAYWLGFLYADGYVSKNRTTVELSLKKADIEHLEKFREFLKNKNEVKIGKSKCNGKEFLRCRLTITDKHFHDTLINKGCIPNKSLILVFPKESIFASKDLIIHFIRGYFDGDGCITCTSKKELEVNIIGTKEFLSGIKKYCPNSFTSSFHKNSRHLDSNTYFIINARNKAISFCKLLYNNATIFLQRKYDKFNNLKDDKR